MYVASEAHKNQTRKGDGGAPYINHLIEVAFLLSDVASVSDASLLQAAILHDSLEDTELNKEQLLHAFGEEVVSYIEAVSDDKTLSLSERRQKQIEHISNASDEIKLLKLADHCSNISSIPPNWDLDRITEYLDWSHEVASKCFSVNAKLAELYLKRLSLTKSKLPSA
jgi:guanosine-3',5'-bis(diphosphate) 3'-pyrophosphohydrolase